jgi:hypothetical protein
MAKKVFNKKTIQEAPVEFNASQVKHYDEKIALKKAFLQDKSTWVPLTLGELKSLTMGEVIEELVVLLLHFTMGGRDYYVVNTDTQWKAVKKKYPDACIIHISQLIRLWTHYIDADYLNTTGPKVLMAIEEFQATVENIIDTPQELQ